MKLKRSCYAGETIKHNIGDEVVLAGWIAKQRDLGNLIFADLRDRSGITQLAFDDSSNREVFETASKLRSEFVVAAKGVIRERSSKNDNIPTGKIELFVTELEILAKSETPPFEIDREGINEELRLKYRYLDLRTVEMQKNIIARHRIVKLVRDYFDQQGFVEIETPILIKSTPEGARDYLVPSRVHKGKFYALPQSPQLYKQLSMLSGFDRYLQIARCFRDEDLRADRQPEFTQIDLEMSFVDQEDVISMNEGLIKKIFAEFMNMEVSLPLKRLTYAEAMENYGSDKPDTRFGFLLNDISDIVKDTEFAVFKGAIEGGGSVRAINIKGAASTLTRKEVDKLTEVAKLYKAKGLAFTRYTEENRSSSFEKFLSAEEIAGIDARVNFEVGDVLLIVGDTNNDIVFDALGQLRLAVAKRLDLIKAGTFDLLWVTDFPLVEYIPEDGRYYAKHHPFTQPKPEDMQYIETDLARVRANAYDLIINGYEIGGGSIRISDQQVQHKMFEILGFSKEEAEERFGFLLDAFKYGVPPHGGLAFGLDRLVMVLLEKEHIRDVIPFPKVQNASELMTSCPSEVPTSNTDELHIKVIEQTND